MSPLQGQASLITVFLKLSAHKILWKGYKWKPPCNFSPESYHPDLKFRAYKIKMTAISGGLWHLACPPPVSGPQLRFPQGVLLPVDSSVVWVEALLVVCAIT